MPQGQAPQPNLRDSLTATSRPAQLDPVWTCPLCESLRWATGAYAPVANAVGFLLHTKCPIPPLRRRDRQCCHWRYRVGSVITRSLKRGSSAELPSVTGVLI